jgi:hypothetical protein
MPEETILSMERLIDDPSNGVMLHADVHSVFDKLKVYFERNPEVSPADIRAITSYIDQCFSEKMSTHSRRWPVGHGFTLAHSSIRLSPFAITPRLIETYRCLTPISLLYTQAYL